MKTGKVCGVLALLALMSSGCELLLQGRPGDVCPKEDPALHEGETPTSLEHDCRCEATAGTNTNLPPGCLPIEYAEDHYGGNLGESGSVSFMFERVGLIVYGADAASADDMFEVALEAGASSASGGLRLPREA